MTLHRCSRCSRRSCRRSGWYPCGPDRGPPPTVQVSLARCTLPRCIQLCEAPHRNSVTSLQRLRHYGLPCPGKPQFVDPGVGRWVLQSDPSCLPCICEAASGCDETIGCDDRGFCGPFLLSKRYWTLSGKPLLKGDSADRPAGTFLTLRRPSPFSLQLFFAVVPVFRTVEARPSPATVTNQRIRFPSFLRLPPGLVLRRGGRARLPGQVRAGEHCPLFIHSSMSLKVRAVTQHTTAARNAANLLRASTNILHLAHTHHPWLT